MFWTKLKLHRRNFGGALKTRKGTYVTSWKQLEKHKHCGGLGFRNLKTMNKALLVRAAWRICTNTNTHWGRAIQAKYFAHTSLLHANLKTNCSWFWRGIQKQINFIKLHSRWRLGSGTKIKIWLDVWIQGSDEPPTPKEGCENSEMYVWVNELICQDSKEWNRSLINHLFDPQTAANIFSMRLPDSADDKLIWTLTNNGEFTLKSAYNRLHADSQGNLQTTTTIQNTGLNWKEFWKLQTWPRVQHFLWKCLIDILPTKERLSRNCTYINAVCPMCNQYEETLMHILFQCAFSKAVWSLTHGGSLVLRGGYNNFAELLEIWIKQNWSSENLQIMLVTTWSIWNTRCEVNFQNLKTQPQKVVQKASSFATYLDKLYSQSQCRNCLSPTTQLSVVSRHWLPPPPPYLKLNCDASYDKVTKFTGIALILRDHAGNWRGGASKCYAGVDSSEQAECLAFYDAVCWSQSLQLSHVILETDFKGIESYVNDSTSSIAWNCETLLIDAMNKLSCFVSWECKFVPRLCNKAADILSKHSRLNRISSIWLDYPPEIIISQLLSDNISSD